MPPRSARLRHSPVPFQARKGFALLITVVLVAFLVLLLVGLATFTRVETQVADNSQQLAKARSNALFALNLAVGQLQRYAGPDRRVTARADINTANTGNPFWTGVWAAEPPDPANPTHSAAPASSAPLAWLVSGNETNGTALTPAASAVAVPGSANDSVWLLRHAAGLDLSDTSEVAADWSVRLKKSAIEVPAAQVPGRVASDPDVRIGSYAWWVGDEGVKAKIPIDDPYRASAANSDEAAWRRESAPRPGLELLSDAALSSVFTATTDAFEVARSRVLFQEQIIMLGSSLASDPGRKALGSAFHDLTVHGQGVLADTLRGGLRRDLTRGLATAPAAGTVSNEEIGDSVAVFTPPTPGPYGRAALGPTSAMWSAGDEPAAPTWASVRAWFGIRAPVGGGAKSPVSAPLSGAGGTIPTTSGHALLPLPVAVQIGYGVDIVGGELRLMLLPRVVLINPYNVPLASADYTVCYIPSVQNTDDWRVLVRLDKLSAPTTFIGSAIGMANYLPARRLAFNITTAFEPGEVRVFSPPAGADNTRTRGLVQLEAGVTSAYLYAQQATPVTETWFSDPNNIRARISSMPRDHPRVTIALGTTTENVDGTVNVPAESLHARYIQTEAEYVNPQTAAEQPSGIVGTGDAKMLRMLRFSLRDGSIGRISNGQHASGDSASGTTPADATSGVRMLIDNNPRAITSQMVGGWRSVAQYVATVANKGTTEAELDYDGENAFWGGSHRGDSYGTSHAILFDVLRSGEEVVSLGRLGHVNWGVDGKHPAYPLGNSFASIFYTHDTPDYGYALNEAIWDRFFFSTLPTSLASRPAHLPNSRLRFHDPAGSMSLASLEGADGYQLAAKRLLIDGAFNINSTSVEAWATFLGGVQAADYAYRDRSGSRTDSAVRVFPRTRNLHDADPVSSTGNLYEWTGYRALSADQIRRLAQRIVDSVKSRARPARSLAEFINRDLAATDARNQTGIMQTAINAEVNADNPSETGGGGDGLDDLVGIDQSAIVPTTFAVADNPDAARGKLRSAGAPGFLLQSDLLTPLAPAISARSDTFRVRTYGETINPATGEIMARAWCEAVVQRLPEFVGGEAAELRIDDPALGAASRTFGRKFVVTQFRWLGPDDI